MRAHLTRSKTGESVWRACRATKRACPLGEAAHREFDSTRAIRQWSVLQHYQDDLGVPLPEPLARLGVGHEVPDGVWLDALAEMQPGIEAAEQRTYEAERSQSESGEESATGGLRKRGNDRALRKNDEPGDGGGSAPVVSGPVDDGEPSEEERAAGEARSERITTLLTDRIPLMDDRHGKVPELRSTDDVAKANGRLATYLDRNFDGDRATATLDALRSLYPGADIQPLDPYSPAEGQPTSQRFPNRATRDDFLRRRAEEVKRFHANRALESGDKESATYYDATNDRVIFVTRGKRTTKNLYPNAYFRGTGQNLRSLNFGSVLAASAVAREMDREPGLAPSARAEVVQVMLQPGRDSQWAAANHAWKWHPDSISGDATASLMRSVADHVKGSGADPSGFPVLDLGDDATIATAQQAMDYAQQVHDWCDRRIGEIRDPDGSPSKRVAHLERLQRDVKRWSGSARVCVEDQCGRYRRAIGNILDDESNGQMNRAYAKRANSASRAKVFEYKKNRDEAHDMAIRSSSFARIFGGRHMELDDSADLAKFRQLDHEFDGWSRTLPEQVDHDTNFRFRFTGNHNATGLYFPGMREVIVDPRHPDSLTHEYFHNLDYTKAKDGQLSMDPKFRSIVRDYKDNIDRKKMGGTNPERYLAPTEVFARAGELYMNWRHPDSGSSFLKTKETYETRFDYAPLLKHKQEIIRLFDGMFGKH
ncbi:hypothetical protein [Bifidobacterium olomucense]|uniref:Uncharacterized protein n=1 Tax=Bifidobacterium olomucense TaxID=2675324 RepID=A0A7Y0EZF3_9BIFI|nr:hypothetical protein [Bifidobacterium sp. DSM 109959]NMM99217.1 hypothetical protein [Bifidobacterium sp. DSM 109959]